MNGRTFRILFPVVFAITLFSYWAGFALLIVNKLFYKDLPGYKIGRICIWEFVALIIAIIITKTLINRWGNVETKSIENKKYLIINPKFGLYFGIYFMIAVIVGIWQFCLFSHNF